MKPRVLAVIPARYKSRRFPGKVLARIGGRSMLEHIYREVSGSRLIDRAVIATDSAEVIEAARGFGADVIMTSRCHKTGSDRSAEVLEKLGGQMVVSIQVDHIGVKYPDYDRVVAAMMADPGIKYATIIKRVEGEEQLYDPSRVKVLIDAAGEALWFSRYPLPYLQGVDGNRLEHHDYYYHIGVYFFRRAALLKFHSWPGGYYEKAESLEQLRILEHHEKIRTFKIKSPIISIDTPEDLKAAKKLVL